MVRVKKGVTARAKHKKVLKQAKGYWMSRSRQFKKAKEAVLHAGQYAYDGRKMKKREFRSLWIMRLNAAVRSFGLTYSQFISKLSDKKIGLDRKVLAKIATDHPAVFEKIVAEVNRV